MRRLGCRRDWRAGEGGCWAGPCSGPLSRIRGVRTGAPYSQAFWVGSRVSHTCGLCPVRPTRRHPAGQHVRSPGSASPATSKRSCPPAGRPCWYGRSVRADAGFSGSLKCAPHPERKDRNKRCCLAAGARGPVAWATCPPPARRGLPSSLLDLGFPPHPTTSPSFPYPKSLLTFLKN